MIIFVLLFRGIGRLRVIPLQLLLYDRHPLNRTVRYLLMLLLFLLLLFLHTTRSIPREKSTTIPAICFAAAVGAASSSVLVHSASMDSCAQWRGSRGVWIPTAIE